MTLIAELQSSVDSKFVRVKWDFDRHKYIRINIAHKIHFKLKVPTTQIDVVHGVKTRPHQQQCRSNRQHCRSYVRLCRSNIRLCCHKQQQCRTSIVKLYPFDNVECCFDIVAGMDGALLSKLDCRSTVQNCGGVTVRAEHCTLIGPASYNIYRKRSASSNSDRKKMENPIICKNQTRIQSQWKFVVPLRKNCDEKNSAEEATHERQRIGKRWQVRQLMRMDKDAATAYRQRRRETSWRPGQTSMFHPTRTRVAITPIIHCARGL